MKTNDHDRARKMISLEDGSTSIPQDQAWLRGHLQECAACRQHATLAGGAIRALRSEPLPSANPAVMRAIQRRVQARSGELAQARQRTRAIWLASGLVALASVPTTSLSWSAFAWLGAWGDLPRTVWQGSAAIFLIAPTLVAAAVLIARDIHSTPDH